MIFKTPIAWLQLTHQRSRLIITIIGVTFAVLLMFLQLGLRDGLFEDSITIHKALRADLVILSSEVDSFFKAFSNPVPRVLLYNLYSIPGVTSVIPLYIARGNFENPDTFEQKPISVCAFKSDKSAFKLPEVNRQLAAIEEVNTFLFDRLSLSEYGPIASDLKERGIITTELEKEQIKIAGVFSLGGGVFSSDGLLITSDISYAQIFNEPLEKVHLGLIEIDPSVDQNFILKRISAELPAAYRVVTIQEFMRIEKKYWAKYTPIGFIFNILAFISFIFGGVIVYQIIYTQISDYLQVYATLKAIGYSSIYLVGTVVQEAVIMSFLGYVPSFAICMYLYSFIHNATRLPMTMTLDRALLVGFLTIFMCSLAGILAINKLRSADPADLF